MQRRRDFALAAIAAGMAMRRSAMADPLAEMSPAQRLLFETPHLSGLQPPLRLDYAFRREAAGHDPVDDRIRLVLRETANGACCDVTPEFLTEARAIRYPSAPGFQGNPLLLYALDRDARELSAATGGSTQWFRNRFRRALIERATATAVDLAFGGGTVAATEIVVAPYQAEPRAGRYQDWGYRFVLAAAVPGWIASIRAGLAGGDVAETIAFTAALPGTAP